jgi:hypothetical protein
MKARAKVLAKLGMLTGLAMLLIPCSISLAQQDDRNQAAGLAFLGIFMLFFFVFFVAMYVYMALALQTIAKKTNTENPWLAWIPIANLFLMVNIARKPLVWVLLLFIPIVGVILVWMPIAEARGKPSWWGILAAIPPVNLIVPGYLAWAD